MFKDEIVEKIKNQAISIDKRERIPEDLLAWMYEEKMFKLFVPNELGGKMMDLPQALRVFEEVSKIEGNLGWLTAIGSGGGMFVPLIHTEIAEALFKSERAVLAGSGYPQGTSKKVEGGYRVSGEWKYCSGSEFASFFTANSVKENGEVTSCIFMPEQVETVCDWNAFGLRGTGSHTIKVRDAFVPEEHTFQLEEIKNDYASYVHTFPFLPFSQATFTSVCLGIAAAFFQEAIRIARRRLENGHTSFKDVLKAVEEKESWLLKTKASFYDEIEELWNCHKKGQLLSEEQEASFSETCKRSVDDAILGANLFIRHLGMEAVMENSVINKIWRDLYTAGQHTFVTP